MRKTVPWICNVWSYEIPIYLLSQAHAPLQTFSNEPGLLCFSCASLSCALFLRLVAGFVLSLVSFSRVCSVFFCWVLSSLWLQYRVIFESFSPLPAAVLVEYRCVLYVCWVSLLCRFPVVSALFSFWYWVVYIRVRFCWVCFGFAALLPRVCLCCFEFCFKS